MQSLQSFRFQRIDLFLLFARKAIDLRRGAASMGRVDLLKIIRDRRVTPDEGHLPADLRPFMTAPASDFKSCGVSFGRPRSNQVKRVGGLEIILQFLFEIRPGRRGGREEGHGN